jgi:hypothetical protein
MAIIVYWTCNFTNRTLTPWSRDLLEELIVIQLNKKSSPLYGIRSFSTVFTTDSQ